MEAAVSFVVSTIGLQIPFVITDVATGLPISNALSATATLIAHDGRHFPLTLASPISGEFHYVTTGTDFRSPMHGEAYIAVSFGTQLFFTHAVTINVVGHF